MRPQDGSEFAFFLGGVRGEEGGKEVGLQFIPAWEVVCSWGGGGAGQEAGESRGSVLPIYVVSAAVLTQCKKAKHRFWRHISDIFVSNQVILIITFS